MYVAPGQSLFYYQVSQLCQGAPRRRQTHHQHSLQGLRQVFTAAVTLISLSLSLTISPQNSIAVNKSDQTYDISLSSKKFETFQTIRARVQPCYKFEIKKILKLNVQKTSSIKLCKTHIKLFQLEKIAFLKEHQEKEICRNV